MVGSQKIRYLILAGLVVSLPVQPMGWFDSTKAKVGIAALVCASVAAGCYVWHRVKKSRKQAAEREALRVVREQEKNELRRLLGDNVIIDENHPDFYTHVHRALFKAVTDRNEKNIALLMKGGGRINLSFTYNSQEECMSGWSRILNAKADQIKAFLKYAETINVSYNHDGVSIAGSINRRLGFYIQNDHTIEQRHLNKALDHSIRAGIPREINLFLDLGADVNVQSKEFYPRSPFSVTPIFVAARFENPAIIKLLLDRGACIDTLKKNWDAAEDDIYDEVRYSDKRAEVMQILDEHRRKKYSDNTNAIEREIFNTVGKLSTSLIKITAAYAAEYPLMVRRPLVFKQEQDKVQIQEVPMIEAPAQVPHPLSLDTQAV